MSGLLAAIFTIALLVSTAHEAAHTQSTPGDCAVCVVAQRAPATMAAAPESSPALRTGVVVDVTVDAPSTVADVAWIASRGPPSTLPVHV